MTPTQRTASLEKLAVHYEVLNDDLTRLTNEYARLKEELLALRVCYTAQAQDIRWIKLLLLPTFLASIGSLVQGIIN
jgi:hypothetical protein